MAVTRSGRGRQAEAARNDRLVLEAAREVFGEHGFETPITAVAERAGVGVGTLYRRYGSKEELLQELCVLSMRQNLAAAEEALTAEDAWCGLVDYVRTCVGFAAGALSPVAGHVEVTDAMSRLARRVQKAVDELVRRAQRDGTLREDVSATDIMVLIERFGAGRPSLDRALRERQLAINLSGLRPGTGMALPGVAPTPRAYRARWR